LNADLVISDKKITFTDFPQSSNLFLVFTNINIGIWHLKRGKWLKNAAKPFYIRCFLLHRLVRQTTINAILRRFSYSGIISGSIEFANALNRGG
jgi:hypothetical protein